MSELGPRRARRAAGGALTTPAPTSRTSPAPLPAPDHPGGSSGRPSRGSSGRPARGSSAGPGRPKTAAQWRRWAILPACGLLLLGWAATCLVRVAATGILATVVVALATGTPFIAVAAVPILTLGIRRRRWICLAMAVVAAIFPWTLVLGYASASDRTPATDTAAVRVMLVNAHEGAAAPSDIVSVVAANAVDLLVVTELSSTLAHDLTAAGLDRLVSPRWVSVAQPGVDGVSVDGGIGIWSSAELGQAQPVVGTVWPAITARVVLRESTFTLVTGHVVPPLTHGGRAWGQDLAALRNAAVAARAQGPVVVLANLNATPWHADLRAFAAAGLVDSADALGQGLRPTWPSWSPLAVLPLDHALVGGGVAVDRVDTVVIAGTDHRALVVSLGIPRSTSSGKGG